MKTTADPNTIPLSARATALVELWQARHSISITTDAGSFEIKDEGSFKLLLELLERVDNISAIQLGLDDINAGRTVPLDEFKRRLREKHGL